MTPTVRPARHGDYDDVVRMTEDVWPDREMADYVPDVFPEWVDGEGPDRRTAVVEVDGRAVGLAQGVTLTDEEAWFQGLRVHPAYRNRGLSRRLTSHLFEWAAAAGATVGRAMVFSWNEAGLGQSLAAGFEAAATFRWAHPEPAEGAPALPVRSDPDAAWRYWRDSDARDTLAGLALDADETWALSTLTRATLERLAAEQRVLTVGAGEPRGLACRVRTVESGDDRVAEYAVGTWADADAAQALVTAISADAAALGVDRTRVLLPETPRHATQAVYAGSAIDDCPDFVMEQPL